MNKKVLVTGIGWLTPLGHDVEEVWGRLLAGESGVGPITGFDAAAFPTRIAGEVKDFEPTEWIEKREAKRLDRFVQFALAASQLAVDDAGLSFPAQDPFRVGALLGSGAGGLKTVEDGQSVLLEKGPSRVSPLSIPRMMINAASSHVARRFGLRGPTFGVALACATGSLALAQAAEQIRLGRADVMLAGGSEASITPLGVAAFSACGSLSKRNEEPQRACRPFDTQRDGFVMAEGAGVLVLESEEHAKQRGASVYADLAGWGLTSDVFHITAPDPEGISAGKAIEFALESAGEKPEAVGYINAHGTSTPLNDPIESNAIYRALGACARRIPVSSTKSMLGHQLGAAGAVEAAMTALTIHHGRLPPTINVDDQDPACEVNVLTEARSAPALRLALSNSLAFGGHNAVLAMRKVGE